MVQPAATAEVGPRFDHERFKNVAAGIQSILVVIGLAVGGIWSATTLAGPRKAVAEAEKAQADAELAKRELAADAVVACTITVKQVPSAKREQRWILIEVALRNVGNQPLKLELGERMQFYASRNHLILKHHSQGC